MYVPQNKGERVFVKDQLVRVTSLRLRTFARKGIKCACCGLEGKYFAIERSPNSTGPYHLNLWALDKKGREIIMTHDHIVARALGGGNTLSECQTMCGPCNWKKGQKEGEEVRRRREEGTLTLVLKDGNGQISQRSNSGGSGMPLQIGM
jgi:hypothetical protein